MKTEAQEYAELRLLALQGRLHVAGNPVESIGYQGSDPDLKRVARLSVRDLERYVARIAA